MGRKSVDEVIESNLNQVVSMLKSGCKDKEIIEFLGISRSAWKAKKKENEKLKAAIEEAKDERDEEVEERLFKNCIGYHYYEEVATKIKYEVTETTATGETIVLTKEDVKVSSVKKYKTPDLQAQKYWLDNRKKAVWKEDPHKVDYDKEVIKLKKKELKGKTIPLL